MIYIYRFLLFPVVLSIFSIASFFNNKIKTGFKLRFSPPQPLPNTDKKLYWFHCSSGEFEYAKPVISQLKKQNPSCYIFVTYFTPTQRKVIDSYPDVDSSYPLPFDTPSPIIRLIKQIKPEILLIAKTDFWPELLWQANKMKIKTWLFSCTVSQDKVDSFFKKIVYKWFYSFFEKIFVASEQDKINGEKIAKRPKWIISGDSRYDQAIARLNNPKPYNKKLFNSYDGYKLIAGSTWPEDEKIVLSMIAALKSLNMKFVIAPHEPTSEHLKKLTSDIDKLGLSSQLYTKSKETWSHDILIIDTVGILADIYKEMDFAFVGGSFKKSVHSVMEPLAMGLPIFIGPYHQNNREANEFKSKCLTDDLKMVNVVTTPEDFKNKLLLAIKLDDYKEKIQQEISKKIGASQRITDSILRFL